MIVTCDTCKIQMGLIAKDQNAADVTRSTYACGECHARVVVHRRGARVEDVGAEPPSPETWVCAACGWKHLDCAENLMQCDGCGAPRPEVT